MGQLSFRNVFISGRTSGSRAAATIVPPVADFSTNVVSGTAPLTVNFTDTSTNSPTEWAWDFNNNGFVDSTVQNPSTTYNTPGTYTVKLVATNSSGSGEVVKTSVITVTQPVPVADFSTDTVSGPAPLTVNFTDTSTNSPTSWAWDFNNDGTTDSTVQSPSYSYSTPGTYSAKLTATNSGGSGQVIKLNLITVAQSAPVADFSANLTSGTAPLTVTFTDTSTNSPSSWAWDFNDDGTTDSTAQNPTTTYNTSGTYSVKLIATNSGGSDTEVKTNMITVSPSGSHSAFFDGNGDYLTVPSNSAFAFGTGDFTIECWAYFRSTGGYQMLAMLGDGIDAVPVQRLCSWAMYLGDGGLNLNRYTPGFSGATWAWTPTANQWYHIVISRSGTSLRAFVNGTQLGTTLSNGVNYTAVNSTPLTVGRFIAGGGASYWMNGYISNLRIVKGTALYTSNFTPSTSALAVVSNTSLLTFRDGTFIDRSDNNFAITTYGNASISSFSPITT
jgi:hypothetical protein